MIWTNMWTYKRIQTKVIYHGGNYPKRNNRKQKSIYKLRITEEETSVSV